MSDTPDTLNPAGMLTPEIFDAFCALPDCQDQQPGEPMPEYQHRLLRYALTCGLEPLTLSQLEAADVAAARAVASLPARLDTDSGRLDTTMHALRLRMAARMTAKRRQRAALQRALDELGSDSPNPDESPTGSPDAPESQSDADRAARLLKAALLLIMGPPDPGHGGPGSPAKLIPPRPTLPGSGVALPRPQAAATQKPDVAF